MAPNPVIRMALASVAVWAVMTLTIDRDRLALLLGMAGPLTAALASWVLLGRVHAAAPERVSGVLVKLFGAKMVLVGGYVGAVLLLFPAAQTAFIASFVVQYVLLHLLEALSLRRLFSDRGLGGRHLRVG